ncbi:copper resistance CopC/CopD family protein [Pilimelia columellifera]|uniref:Copper resistance protein CopC n=1 Tax=Pilimelia columellifera subsp. columellifera TaxID=706583 RepID=A0ABN3NJP6_9ACTN
MTESLDRRAPAGLAARLTAVAVALLALFATVLLPAAPASAHAVLVSSTPRVGAVLPTAPSQVLLEFSEPVSLVADKVRVLGPDGKRADAGNSRSDGARVAIPLNPNGPQGTYLVSFRIISADGHPVPGGFVYSVGAPSANPPTLADVEDPVDPVAQGVMSAIKFLGYAGLLVVVGAVMVLGMLWPRRLDRRPVVRLAWVGLGVIALSAVLALLAQAPYSAGRGMLNITATDLRQVLASDMGTGHLIRLGVLAACAFLLPPVLAGRAGKLDVIPLALLATVGVATWPLAGHPVASPVPALSVVVDAFHVVGMAVWLGGLFMLLVFLLPRANDEELGAILPVWSRWAVLAVAAILLSGTVQVLVEVGTVDGLLTTRYGALVLVKIGLLAVVVAAATYARKLTERPETTTRPGRLRQVVAVELAVTTVILAVSAVLGQTPPARSATAAAQQASGPFSTTVTTSLYTLQVELSPGGIGMNEMHAYAYTPAGRPQPVVEWRASATLAAAGVEAVTIPLVKLADNHATGQFVAPTAGQWQLRFGVRTSDVDEASVTVTVPIS